MMHDGFKISHVFWRGSNVRRWRRPQFLELHKYSVDFWNCKQYSMSCLKSQQQVIYVKFFFHGLFNGSVFAQTIGITDNLSSLALMLDVIQIAGCAVFKINYRYEICVSCCIWCFISCTDHKRVDSSVRINDCWIWNGVGGRGHGLISSVLQFLGAFTELRKAAVTIVMSVRMGQLGSHWTDFHEIWYLIIFRKYVQKSRTRIKGNLHEDQYTFSIISRSVILKMKKASDKSCRENQNTYFVFNNFFFRESCRLWDNVEKYCRAGRATDDSMAHTHCMMGN